MDEFDFGDFRCYDCDSRYCLNGCKKTDTAWYVVGRGWIEPTEIDEYIAQQAELNLKYKTRPDWLGEGFTQVKFTADTPYGRDDKGRVVRLRGHFEKIVKVSQEVSA
jgi:hypothetical protein